MSKLSALLALLFVCVTCSPLQAKEAPPKSDTALADYVAKPDASYGWTKRQETKIGKTTVVELILTSQTWQDTTWRHQLVIIKPSVIKDKSKHALLLIGGGRWKDEYLQPPTQQRMPREVRLLAPVVEQLGTPVAVLRQVPQQPLFDGLVEDALISLTFEKFVRTGDSEWPLLLPMVKSAARAMDATTEFAKKEWDLDIETYTITGASKRGWTTWLTGAVDPRATAIAPMVIDMLNMAPHMRLQIAAWGDFSHQIHDYTDRGLHKMLETEAGGRLRKIVDPYNYVSKLKQPKLIILGTNDAYWPLDAANLYWNELSGEKYLLYVPNNGHGLNDMARVLGGITALHQRQATGKPMPKLDWKYKNGNGKITLTVNSDRKPKQVQAWTATSATRDFRESTWTASPIEESDGQYIYEMPIPTQGHAAVFGEAIYNGESVPFYLSTNVKVVGEKAEAAGE